MYIRSMCCQKVMRKAVTPRKLVHYAIIVSVVWISYRLYINYQGSPDGGRHKTKFGHTDKRRGQDDRAPAINVKIKENRPIKVQEMNSDDRNPKFHRGQREHNEDVRFNDDEFVDDKRINEQDRLNRQIHIPRDVEDNGEHAVVGNDRFQHKRQGDKLLEDGTQNEDSLDDKKLLFEEIFEAKDKPKVAEIAKKKDGRKEKFQVEPEVDWDLEQEFQSRRKKFLDDVAKRAEAYDPEDFKDMQELDDHLAFITAATNKTSWLGLVQFIYSVQYFYPRSDIGIYDLGLNDDARKKLESYCRVSVIPSYMKFWPEHLTDMSKTLWRPMVWQMGLAHYGHVIYVEPERFLQKKNMKDYIEHSRRFGITVVGRKLQYSPYVVTHPEMYFFFNVDTRKLQRVNMFDLTMLILHNSKPVRHEFMRYLVSCALEEYCISPPGAQEHCDQRLFAGSKKYASCHRYEVSAVNILLDKWFQFKQEDFLVRDLATAHYNGKDVTSKVKTCADAKEEV